MKIISSHWARLLGNILFLLFLAAAMSFGQSSPRVSTPSKSETLEDKKIEYLRWREFADSLAQEARSVVPEDSRPFAIADVAGVYWDVDKATCRKLFELALDVAWSIFEKDKKKRGHVNYVISSASKLDVSLAKHLTNKLLEKEESEKERDDLSSSTALDVLKQDPIRAAQLAEAFAPNGLQNGSANFFIFRLAAENIQLSNRVYGTYLSRAGASESVPLEGVVSLAGYAFGYTEYYTIDQRGQLIGATFPRVQGLSENPAFIGALLNLASRRLIRTIERRNTATGGEIEALNYSILFALGYLIPEVERFAPASLPAWRQLYDLGIVQTTPQQVGQIAKLITSIKESRSRVDTYNETSELDAEASLENVEKLIGTCQRDVVYSRAALTFSARKNFKRAGQVVAEIEDLKQSDSVKQVIIFDQAITAIENGDWKESGDFLKKITNKEIQAIGIARMANALLRKGASREGYDFLDEAATISEKVVDAKNRSGLFFGLSSMVVKENRAEFRKLFLNGIKSLNKSEPSIQMRLRIPVKVSLGCNGDTSSWYGSVLTLPNSDILDVVPLSTKDNPDETKALLDEISDKVTRVRSLAIVARLTGERFADVAAQLIIDSKQK